MNIKKAKYENMCLKVIEKMTPEVKSKLTGNCVKVSVGFSIEDKK